MTSVVRDLLRWFRIRLSAPRAGAGTVFRGGPVDVDLLTTAERASLGYAVALLVYAHGGGFVLFTESGALRVSLP